ncbi:MAG: hypothetical protein QNK04_01940 [Myxococcota bacterium]|nr:hypothetical protein [Myxococcota bacterium]
MRLPRRFVLFAGLALATSAAAEATFYGNVRETLTFDPDCSVPSDPTGPEVPDLAWFPNADGTQRALAICGSESLVPEVVWLLDLTSEGVTQRAAISYSGDTDPPGLVDAALPGDASAVFERYGAPTPAWRWRAAAADLTFGVREDVAVFPHSCGGITWTGTAKGFAASGTSLTAIVFGAANDGVVTYTREGPGNWSCVLKFTTPAVLPGGVPVDLIDDVLADGARTLVSEFIIARRLQIGDLFPELEPPPPERAADVDLAPDGTFAINTGSTLRADFSPFQTLHQNGELLEGREIFTFALGRQARAGQLLVFTATFSDFSEGYFVAAFTGPPAVPAVGGVGALALSATLLVAALAVLRLRRS